MTRAFVIVGFLIAFAAGWIAGGRMPEFWTARAPEASPTTRPTTRPQRDRPDPGSYLAQQLGLTAQQQSEMREIWAAATGRGWRQTSEQRRQLREQRDAAIEALFGPEDKAAYDAVLSEYEQKLSALEAQSRQAFADAVERTKALLNEPQRAKFEEILRQWDTRDRHRGEPATRDGTGGRPVGSGGGAGDIH